MAARTAEERIALIDAKIAKKKEEIKALEAQKQKILHPVTMRDVYKRQPPPELPEILVRELHTCRQDIHHHIHLHRQFEQQAADPILAGLHSSANGGEQYRRQGGEGILGGQVFTVKLERLFHEFILTSAIGEGHSRGDLLLRLR